MRNIYRTYREHYKALFYLGLPIVIGQIGVIILGFADTLMIGHHSTIELGAASFVNNVFNLAIIFSTGFSYGLTPIVGGLYGTHQFAPAGQALRNSLLANLMVALLLTICMTLLFLNIERLGQPEELIPLIKPYYLVLLASLVFVMLFNGFKQFTDGITDTKTAMWILLGGNVLNIIGNYILIYGKLGFPELGLLGAGISTLFSRIVMVVVFVIIFMRSPRFIRYKVGFFRLGWSRAVFSRLNGLGWPVAFQMGMETASFSLSAIMIGWLGTIALASHQVMLAISQFTFMMYYGMGAAVAVRVSNFNGQDDMVNVRRSAYAGFHLMMALGVVLSFIVFLCRNYLGGWFTDSSEVAVNISFPCLPVWRRLADHFCQRFAWNCRRKTDDGHRFYRLFHYLVARRLFLRFRDGMGCCRRMDGGPFWIDKCRADALVAFPLHDETACPPTITCNSLFLWLPTVLQNSK